MLCNLLVTLCVALPQGAPFGTPSGVPSGAPSGASLHELGPRAWAPSPTGAADPVAAWTIDVKEVYAEQCAKCHGEKGDGKGTAELTQPARSFLDGGYSYGNTDKAILRSITYGIPGTPMPAFGKTLSEEDRKALTDYVIGLGPKGTIVTPGASVLAVVDKPVIVHGKLPALKEGLRGEPRSLVVGFRNGSTFVYAKNQRRLSALLVGDFLNRSDWGGRGGTALKPLGTITWMPESENESAAALVDGNGKALTSKIRAARIVGDDVRLDFTLFGADGKRVGGGNEFLSFLDVGGVPVPQRSIVAVGRSKSPATFAAIEGDAVATIDASTDPESGDDVGPKATVKAAGKGVFAIDVDGIPGVRVLVYTTSWSDELTAAVRSSLHPEGR